MKLGALITSLFLLFSAVSLAMPDYADAARMGGGRSFGSSPMMNRPAPAPVQRHAQPSAGPAAAAQPRPGGMFGGMGGLFGGLLAGTLIGSLLGGHGAAGGGGFLDIILIALIAYFGYRLYKRFRASQSQQPAAAGAFSQQSGLNNAQSNTMNRSDVSADGWNSLRSAAANDAPPSVSPNVDIPEGFDTNEFLRGAKMAYNRLQKSWDARDLDDIAQFTTPEVLQFLRQQNAEDPEPSHTEILLVNASLVGVEEAGPDDWRAQVYFDVLMRENPNQSKPESVKELWHFWRIGKDATWKLAGIQQLY